MVSTAEARPPAPTMPAGPGQEAGPAAVVLTVKGMVCSFCVQGIEKMLRDIPNVDDLAIDLDTRQVSLWVKGSPPSNEKLERTIKDAGYEVEHIARQEKPKVKAEKAP